MRRISLTAMLTRALAFSAILLLAILLYSCWDEVARLLHAARWKYLVMALLGLTLSNIGMAIVFAQLMRSYTKASVANHKAIGSFLLSQAAKYVPGKLWGLVMQTTLLGSRRTAGGVVMSNIELVIVNVGIVTAIGFGSVIWTKAGFLPALIAVSAGCVICAAMLGSGVVRQISRQLLRKVPYLRRRLEAHVVEIVPSEVASGRPNLYFGLLVFTLMYALGWWLLAMATVEVDAMASITIVAALSLSYVVGVVSLLPAGIGAREGALVLLAPAVGVSHAEMTAFAIASRVAILFVDVISAGVGAMLLLLPRTRGGQGA